MQIDIESHELSINNIADIKELYEVFCSKAVKDYKFLNTPITYEELEECLKNDLINGFIAYEDKFVKGFLLYVIEPHQAIELNVIYLADNKHFIKRKKSLIKALVEKFKDKTDWKVISYPMLGLQENFAKEIYSLKFKSVNQALVKLDFKIENIINITLKSKEIELEQGYTITKWKNEYFMQASEVIHCAFRNSNDINFDPRFLSVEGSKMIVDKIISNIFGFFLPEATSVLMYGNKMAGICFAILNDSFANIPLIGLADGHKNKGYGKYLLKNTVLSLINLVNSGYITAEYVNAAMEPDNYPALKMYRRIGFREDYTYTHAYYKNPNFKE